jgi:hypothetical protein
MIIRMERSGGFTGIPLRAVVDSEQLEAGESRALRNQVEAAGFFNLPALQVSKSKGADRFHYQLTVEDAGHSHTIEIDEEAAPEPLQALIRQVAFLARRARKG